MGWATSESRKSFGNTIPTIRDRVASFLLGDNPSPLATQMSLKVLGSAGAGASGFSLSDLTPMGSVFGVNEMSRNVKEAAHNGDYNDMILAALPVGGGLRGRYATYLREASGGKDPMRIKLTPERMEAAKDLYVNRRANLGLEPEPAFGTAPSPYRRTEQSQEAIKFAEEAKRAGQDVRVKFPDSSNGSVYVRVGDEGTVRFADRLPPIENGQIVGGYSKALGSRHEPATIDVSRGKYSDIDPTPAYDWLSRVLGQ